MRLNMFQAMLTLGSDNAIRIIELTPHYNVLHIDHLPAFLSPKDSA